MPPASVVLAAAWIVAGTAGGVLYALLYGLAAIPGLPLGFLLFGRRQPAGWIAGALLGYFLTAVGIWAGIAAHIPSALTFAAAWLVLSAATWSAARRRTDARVTLPPWDRRATTALAVVLGCTLLLSVPPLARIGERDAAGNRRYRAYFTADFVWHTALTAEVAKFSMPPRNPYLASEPIHYYWTYFLLPAAVSETGPAPLRNVQECLKVNALLTGLLLMASVFMLAWAATGAPMATGAAVSLALLAGSFEGTYEIIRLWSHGHGFGELKNTNIDAITGWELGGHRIDGLPRCLWYVPQHSMVYALGLVALTAVAAAGATSQIGAVLVQGLALAGAAAINPLVGGTFAAAWGAAVVIDAGRRRADFVSSVLRHALAAVPVAVALAWCIASRMVEGAGGVLEFGLRGASLKSPFLSLFLSLGPVLLPAAAGIALAARRQMRALAPSILLSAAALGLMYFVRLRVDTPWVPFRAGQLLLVAAPPLIAAAGTHLSRRAALRLPAAAAFALLMVLGLPTTIIDAYNAQDVSNTSPGSGFHLTGVLDSEQQQALAFIRRATPRTAIVQMEPHVRDRYAVPGGWGEWWSLVPTFAERRMAGGLPISLMEVPAYRATSDLVRAMFAAKTPAEASAIAHQLRINYIYVDGLDRQAFGSVSVFDRAPELFPPVFRRGPVAVYLVQ